MTTNNQCLIGFCGGLFGSNGVGKTTASNFLVKNFNFCLCSISKNIEESAKKLCKWNGNKDKDGLEILNNICIFGRKINENYWLNVALASIPKSEKRIVFDDIFFSNEANFIKNNKGFVIYIERNGYEQPQLDFNYDSILKNSSDINNFEKNIEKLTLKLYNIK